MRLIQYFFTLGFILVSLQTNLAQAAKYSLEDLFTTIRQEKIWKTRKILKQVSANEKNQDGVTPLMVAAAAPQRGFILNGRKNRKIIKVLIKKGANTALVDNQGRNALFYHLDQPNLYKGDIKKLAILIAAKTSVNQKDIYDNTPLFFLLKRYDRDNVNGNYHNQLAKLLIKNHAEFKRFNKSGETPLIITALNANYEMAQFLLQNGANPEDRDSNSMTIPLLIESRYDMSIPRNKDLFCLFIKNGAPTDQTSTTCL